MSWISYKIATNIAQNRDPLDMSPTEADGEAAGAVGVVALLALATFGAYKGAEFIEHKIYPEPAPVSVPPQKDHASSDEFRGANFTVRFPSDSK